MVPLRRFQGYTGNTRAAHRPKRIHFILQKGKILAQSHLSQFLICYISYNSNHMQPTNYYQQTTTTYTSNRTNAPTNAVLINSGLTDRDGAKNVARRILDTYDRDRNGVIDSIEVVPMIVDAYKSFNRVFSPSRADIESYLKILDRNGDGKVTLQDLEDLCTKYLTSKI